MKVFQYSRLIITEVNAPDYVTSETFCEYMNESGWPDGDTVEDEIVAITYCGEVSE